MPKKIIYANHFFRALKRLPEQIQHDAFEKEKLFIIDPFNPQLKTHKLKGKFKNYWSFSISYSYRIMFEFLAEDKILFIDIDDHDIYA